MLVHLSALIFADVARAVANLALPNENEAKAVDARQEIDLRIGASFTRLQACREGAALQHRCMLCTWDGGAAGGKGPQLPGMRGR